MKTQHGQFEVALPAGPSSASQSDYLYQAAFFSERLRRSWAEAWLDSHGVVEQTLLLLTEHVDGGLQGSHGIVSICAFWGNGDW